MKPYTSNQGVRHLFTNPEKVISQVKDSDFIFRFYQIPEIPVQVFEYGYRSVRLFRGLPDELNACFGQSLIVPPEVVGVKEQEHAATGLVPHPAGLLFIGGFGQQQFAFSIARRGYDYPAFGCAQARVFHQNKPEFLRIKFNGLVVIVHYQRDLNNSLFHNDWILSGNQDCPRIP